MKEPIFSGKIDSIYQDILPHPARTVHEEAENAVKFILSTVPFQASFLSKKLFCMCFQKRDPAFLQAVLDELQKWSKRLFDIVRKEENPLAEIELCHILAMYPFLDPVGTLIVPQKINGVYQLIQYAVEPIELTPKALGSALTAFGLTAEGAPSLLLFKGTPPPTGAGSLLSLWTDFVPGLGSGELAFTFFVKKRVGEWIDRAASPIKIFGQSLGGALALLSVCHFPDRKKIVEVHAFSAPALFQRALCKYQGNSKVSVYFQKNDPAPLVGAGFHSSWKLMRIVPRKRQNFFLAHLRIFPVFEDLSVIQVDALEDRKRFIRKIVTLLHAIISIPIFLCVSLILLFKRALY